VHPCRSVASKNGERRYQGPKYSVVDVGVVVVVVAMCTLPSAAEGEH
jgi:hypothetical protein